MHGFKFLNTLFHFHLKYIKNAYPNLSDNTAIHILLRRNQDYDYPQSPIRVSQIPPTKETNPWRWITTWHSVSVQQTSDPMNKSKFLHLQCDIPCKFSAILCPIQMPAK